MTGECGNQINRGTTASVVFSGAEALLNYIEACYEKDGNVDATTDKYWRALRTRAKVNPDYNATIAATDVSKEAMGDFGAYSRGKMVDATLYNIRRERRNELIGEGDAHGRPQALESSRPGEQLPHRGNALLGFLL